ncbi:MAG: DUF4330 domain-containing protein [Lachnospiraceae bacterium]|nr:DUF4330 domain-containing protein [Lachnospiraceae bacterium]
MTANKKFFGLFNLFDIVIVAIVLVLAFGAYFFMHKETIVETKKLTYMVELNDLPAGFSENIHIGDKVTDNVKNYNMGTVTDFKAEAYKKLTEDYETGKMADSIVPDRESVILTIEANVTESESDFRVDGNFLVKAGLVANVKGPGYAGSGFIINIKR